MTPKCWIFLVYLGALHNVLEGKNDNLAEVKNNFPEGWTTYIVADNFTCFIKKQESRPAFVFLEEDAEEKLKFLPQLRTNNASHFLYLEKWLTKKNLTAYVLQGNRCNDTFHEPAGTSIQSTVNSTCDFNQYDTGTCQVTCFNLKTICNQDPYDEQNCNKLGENVKNQYIINITATQGKCYNCDNPMKKPEMIISLEREPTAAGETINPKQAVTLMNGMSKLALSLNKSSAELNGGDGVTGIIVAETDLAEVAEEVTFGYASLNDSLSMVTGKNTNSFQRSIMVSKEAFEKAFNPNLSLVFAAVLRFTNFGQDELNSTVLGNEVLAVDMGANVTNLTDKINIYFEDVTYDGIPSCRSWNSEGLSPFWTDDGCETVIDKNHITCQCSHLTFFAILLIPLNETISSSDLNNLTIITQVGCGLSMFFLAIALFMHFLLRRTRATNTTKILIHLVSVMFLLNFTFLVNGYVASLKSSVGCKIMAALMHYFMLTTFTWFAVQAFHLCLQMYHNGKILIHHYVLKVSVTSWGLPCVAVIVLLSVGKYGEQVIHSDVGTNNVTMCWITDGKVQHIVNIGYYALIFLFTFSTFIITLTWFHCLKRSKSGRTQLKSNGLNIMSIMGLCCLLGITWGFAFLAYGVLRIPSYYIFTVLNSFQGFFLFIYYYTNSNKRETSASPSDAVSSNSSSSSSIITATTLGKDLILENPYCNLCEKKHQT